jgi:hypothetical protein
MEKGIGIITDVTNVAQVITHLRAGQYLASGEEPNLANISYMLFQLAHALPRTPKAFSDTIRGIAFLVEKEAVLRTASMIASEVNEQIHETITQVAANIEDLREAIDHIKTATGGVETMVQNAQEQLEATVWSMQGELEATVRNTQEEIDAVVDRLTQNKNKNDTNPQTTQQTNEEPQLQPHTTAAPPSLHPLMMTYAAVAQQQIPPTHLAAITWGEANDKQIVVQKDPTTTRDEAFEKLTEKELVEKANITLTLMGQQAADAPADTHFVGAKKLRNGNVLYQLSSKISADWMKKKDVQTAFSNFYGGTTNVCTKLLYTLVKFVPVTFDPTSQITWDKIARDSEIQEGNIVYAKYIKPPQYRNAGQRTAHIIMGYLTREAANRAIGKGLFIEGKRCVARKLLPEPKRCLKCQKFDHMANDCKNHADICARCGKEHRTNTCTVSDPTKFKCANCTPAEAEGHGTADRRCPKFTTELTKLQARIPETKYKFFPTNEPHTWRPLDESMINPHTQTYYQGTLQTNQQEPTQGWSDQHFEEQWRIVRNRKRGPRANDNERYGGDFRSGANVGAADNGWQNPRDKPHEQGTLEQYFNTETTREQRGNIRPRWEEERRTPRNWDAYRPESNFAPNNERRQHPIPDERRSNTPLSYMNTPPKWITTTEKQYE